MKGILMFDNLNDLVYFDSDEELSQHIQSLAMKDGLLEDLSFQTSKNVIDKNVVMQLFSPLIASYKVMQAQFTNKYKSMETEAGALIVFDEILNYFVIGISSINEKPEEIKHEISLFILLVRALYGPALHMLKNDISTCCNGYTRAQLLSQILNKWRILKMEQQMFLVEAIERLLINRDITAMCINLLQEVMEKIRYYFKEGSYCHSFALVDTKLLALYSSRNSGQLPKEMLLFLILIAQVLRTSFVSLEQIIQIEEQKMEEQFFIPISNISLLEDEDEKQNKKLEKFEIKPSVEKQDKIKPGAQSLLIYLKSRTGILVPHVLYLIEITQRINLVILCELTGYSKTASSIFSFIEILYNIQCHPILKSPLIMFENLEKEFKILLESICKLKLSDDKYIKKLISKWELMKQCEIEKILNKSKVKSIPPRLESTISSFIELLKCTFEEIVFIPCLNHEEFTWSHEHQKFLTSIQKLCIKRINDVSDYLEVKALQNITMTSYMAEYPGLIHFIYINRSIDCVIAPSVMLKKGHFNGMTSLKKKIWKMVKFGRRYVDGSNNYCCLWKDDDLSFFYNIWFEDSKGKIMKPIIRPNLKCSIKGIICGNYFKSLVKKCFPDCSNDIFCYELFCVHLESTPPEQIISQSQQLCSHLWDFTGVYRTSLDLL